MKFFERRRTCWGCCTKEPKRMHLLKKIVDTFWCPVCIAYFKVYSHFFEDGVQEGELKDDPHYLKFKKEQYGKQQICETNDVY